MSAAPRAQSPAPRVVGGMADEVIQEVKNSRMEITDDGLKAIKAWQYKGGTYTPIDTLLNTYVWTPSATLLPAWMAPNLVTLIGLGWIVLGYAVLVLGYSTDLYKPAPNWVYLLASFCNFVYQTMDACDVALLFSFQVPFWLSQWAEYHTHTMEHSLGGLLGITEGQLVGMFAMAAPAMFGTDFFLVDLGVAILPAWYCGGETCSMCLRDLFLWLQCCVALTFAASSFKSVLGHAKNLSEALTQTVPIFLLMVLGTAWCTTIPHAETHPRLVIFSLGMAFTFLCNKMIVAGMCRMEYKTFHTILLPLPIIYIIARFRLLPRHDDVLLGGYCAFCVYKLQKYTRNVTEEIAGCLGIYVLTLGKRDKAE